MDFLDELIEIKPSTKKSPPVYLPDDCWEHVITFLLHDAAVDHRRCHRNFLLDSLSLVSKQFLSISNRLKLSLTVCDPTLRFLPRLFHRFPNLTSLDITRFHRGDLHVLLRRIERSSLHLRSLKFSNLPAIPTDWLRSFAEKAAKNLTSLTFSEIGSLFNTDLLLISDCFPFLEELDLSFPKDSGQSVIIIDTNFTLPMLRKVNFSGHFYFNDESLLNLFKNCELLEEAVMCSCKALTDAGIAFAIRERPSLRSFSVTDYQAEVEVSSLFISSLVNLKCLTCLDLSRTCISNELLCSIAKEGIPLRKLVLQGCANSNYTYDGIFCLLSKSMYLQHLDLSGTHFLNDKRVAELSMFLAKLVSIDVSDCKKLTDLTLFSFIRNCAMLDEIRMGGSISKNWEPEDYASLDRFLLKPKYQVKSLHLSFNPWLLHGATIEILISIFPNLQLLDLSSSFDTSEIIMAVFTGCYISSSKLKQQLLPKLEVLKLSSSDIDDEALSVISKRFCGLLQLELENCNSVTEKGVREVVENCKQLREINLRNCYKVATNCDNVASTIFINVFILWMVLERPSLRKITAPPCFRPNQRKRKFFLGYGCLVC